MSEARLFYLVAEGILEYDEKIEKNFINRIDRLYRDRKKHPNQRIFPDTLAITIERFAILALIVPEVDISVLNGYADVSPYISFMINPGEYDYSQIDTADYMWINIARNKKYKKYFKEHKKAILDQMKNAFDSENETRDQQKLAYGMLLSENDLWNY